MPVAQNEQGRGLHIPSLVATVETPAFRPGVQPLRRPEGRGLKPELVLR